MNTNTKKIFGTMMVATTLALSLVGCGSATSTADGITEIEFFSQKKEMQTTLREIISDFEAEHPEIKVKFTNVPDPGIVLKTRIASGDAPDVINVFPQNADFQEWAKAGMFEDLTSASYLSNLEAGAAESYAIEDKVYSVPLTSNAWGFFYNKTAFAEMGLTVPQTWSEFETLVKTIQSQEAIPFALSLTTADAWTLNGYHQLAWASVTGGFTQANDALVRSGKDGISLTNADMQAVIERLNLLNGTAQKNANGATYNDAVAAFASGNALIFPNGTWALPAVQSQNPDFEIGMFPFPGETADEALTVGAADLALSISADSKAKEAAQTFVEYMTSQAAMQKYYDVDGSPTSVTAVDTEGKFVEMQGVTDLTFTEKQIIWLQKEWTSEETFHHLTVDYVNNLNQQELVDKLNAFFNTMK